MEPKIVEKGEIKVVGLKCRTSLSDNRVPALWQDFINRWGETKNLSHLGEAYGICLHESDIDIRDFTEETEFTEIVGAEVPEFKDVPDRMVTFTLPPAKYALFTHKGSLESLKNL